jgi:hypothetical protein
MRTAARPSSSCGRRTGHATRHAPVTRPSRAREGAGDGAGRVAVRGQVTVRGAGRDAPATYWLAGWRAEHVVSGVLGAW